MILVLSSVACTLQGEGPFSIPIAGEGYADNHPPPARQAGQDMAESIVWTWTYGGVATYVSPPPLLWVDSSSECTTGAGVHYTGSFPCYGYDGMCCKGLYVTQDDVVYAVWYGKISDTAYAHELCHAWSQYATGDGDNHHTGPCFKGFDGGYETEGSMMFEANRRLRVVGL